MKYKVKNKLPQTINLIVEGKTINLLPYSNIEINKLTKQMNNLSARGFIRICKVKNKKK